ncbi:hypothetical protein [Thermoanaerobacter siderophilus]|uniref:hypothetical protein n=1 Tax=Thermoanaerobacter siderophilus TaxID=106578 RepID=UPI0002E3CF9F|nr:hypothetical protein [Thermoanaerobacter siderophilus]
MEYKNMDMIIKFDDEHKNFILIKGNNQIVMDTKQAIGCIVIFRDILEKIKGK